MLYEVAVLGKPTGPDQKETLILRPKLIVAENARVAVAHVLLTNKELLPLDLNRVEVLVRTFAPSWRRRLRILGWLARVFLRW